MWQTAVGLLIPFLGTTLGASLVFFLKRSLPPRLEKLLLGFASGVMIAASIFSLLLPSLEASVDYGNWQFLPAVVGFLLGMGFLFLIDSLLPHLHLKEKDPEGLHPKKSWGKDTMLFLAVTIHNIPEGLAVGVAFASFLTAGSEASFIPALVLAIGMAVQNVPEGLIVSLPLREEGKSRTKAFLYGGFSGIVEPIFGLLAVLLAELVVPALPYLLSFAAGAMIYVVVEELIPEAQNGKHSNMGVLGVAIGFALMMVLDVALG